MSDQASKNPPNTSKDDEGKGAQQGDNADPKLQKQGDAREARQGGAHDKNG
jgi:hypothetical protein